ncbi:MAG TPA: hypothetical protein DDY78_30050 [Planctomycetales bacterium]|jgi:hypothetical protein|nr:hypothetical protein [Planctomycetales bacterium]
MDGLTLLEEARIAGLTVTVEGNRLRIRGPRWAETIAQRVLAHKDEVVHILTTETAAAIGPDDLPGDWRVEWEERAAVMEYNAGLCRERAEALALTAIVREMRATAMLAFNRSSP